MVAQERSHPSWREFPPGSEHDRQHQANLQRRRNDCGEEHQRRDDLLVVRPQMLDAPEDGGGRVAPDDREAKHRYRVRGYVKHRSPQRQREGPVKRVLPPPPQLLVAARTTRRRAGLKLG